MHYFMSDIHGADSAYFEMKKRIDFSPKDELYIIGDIFDGNSENPKACLDILDDIMQSKNIHLLLGDHEYAHVMCYIMEENEDDFDDNEEGDNPFVGKTNVWRDLLFGDSFQGEPLYRYFRENLPIESQRNYISYLLSCEITNLITIGNHMFYLVHGAPCYCNKGEKMKWQFNVVAEELSITKNYQLSIKSDPRFPLYQRKYGSFNLDDIILITGHVPTSARYETDPDIWGPFPETLIQNKVYYINNRFLLDCGCDGDSLGEVQDGCITALSCLGIDAAGFFVEKIPKIRKEL